MRRYGLLIAVLIAAGAVLLFLAFAPVLDSPDYFPVRAVPYDGGPPSFAPVPFVSTPTVGTSQA